MGEVEFFDKMKKINRLLTNEARESIWNYLLSGEFISVKALLEVVGEGKDWKDFGLEEKGEGNG